VTPRRDDAERSNAKERRNDTSRDEEERRE
jgi:hypothetical protein